MNNEKQSASLIAAFAPIKDILKKDIKARTMGAYENYVGQHGPLKRWPSIRDVGEAGYRRFLVFSGCIDWAEGNTRLPGTLCAKKLDRLAHNFANDQYDRFIVKFEDKCPNLKKVKLKYAHGATIEIIGLHPITNARVDIHQSVVWGYSNQGTPFVRFPALLYVDFKRVTAQEYKEIK